MLHEGNMYFYLNAEAKKSYDCADKHELLLFESKINYRN